MRDEDEVLTFQEHASVLQPPFEGPFPQLQPSCTPAIS